MLKIIVPQHPIKVHFVDLVTCQEALKATEQPKNNKSYSPVGILTEMYKHGGKKNFYQLHAIILKIWKPVQIPSVLRDARIVIIYKKGGR